MNKVSKTYTLIQKNAICRFLWILLLCVFLNHHSIYSQTFFTELSKDKIIVGDQIEWTWKLILDKEDILIQAPLIPDSIGQLFILQKSSIDTQIQSNHRIYTQKIIISGYDSFLVSLPILSAKVYQQSSKDTLILKSENSHQLLVATLDIDTAQGFVPIKEIIEIENPSLLSRMAEHFEEYSTIYIIVGVVFILLLIAYLIYRLVKNSKSASYIERPYEKAYRRMQELENSELWKQQEYKKYYTELSLIIKDYILEEKGIDTKKLTTTELLREFKKNRKLRNLHKPLREILYTADLTKFAKGVPDEDLRNEALQYAQYIIQTIEQDKIPQIPHAQ